MWNFWTQQSPTFFAVAVVAAAIFGFLGGLYGYAQADRAGFRRALSLIARQDAERGV